MGWYAIGLPQTYFLLDEKVPYTRHYRHGADSYRRNEMHSQFIQGCTKGGRCGIGQAGIPVEEGRDYTIRLAVKSADRLLVSMALMTGDRGTTLFQADVQTASEQWQVHEFDFNATVGDSAARLSDRKNNRGRGSKNGRCDGFALDDRFRAMPLAIK